MNEKRYEQAIECFDKVVDSEYGNKGNAYYNLALVFYYIETEKADRNREFGQCLKAIEQALYFLPEDADILNFKAYLLMISSPKLDEAMELFEHSISICDTRNCRINKAICHLLRREFELAINEVNTILKYGMDEDEILYAILGNVFAMYGVENRENAILMFKKAYRINRDVNYLTNIDILNSGRFFDSIFFNGFTLEIYSDEEVMDFYRSHTMKQLV